MSHRTLDAFRNKKSTHSIWFDPSYLPIPIQIDIQRYRFKIILCFITYTWSSSSPTQAPRVNNVKSCRGTRVASSLDDRSFHDLLTVK